MTVGAKGDNFMFMILILRYSTSKLRKNGKSGLASFSKITVK
jgi:hypothetical protein